MNKRLLYVGRIMRRGNAHIKTNPSDLKDENFS